MKQVSSKIFPKIGRTKERVGENGFCLGHERLPGRKTSSGQLELQLRRKGLEGDLRVKNMPSKRGPRIEWWGHHNLRGRKIS